MTDATSARAPEAANVASSDAAARRALERFEGRSGEVRGAVILDGEGLLAATGAPDRWAGPARALLAAADSAAGRPAVHAHVATEEGEVFAVRRAGLAMVAVSERFTLASLVLSDMRAALRDVAAGAA